MRGLLNLFVGKGNIVGAEIGVQFGKNALDMLNNLNFSLLYLIDPYMPFPRASDGIVDTSVIGRDNVMDNAFKALEKYRDKVIWVRGFSYDVYHMFNDLYLDFVYIDGDHRTEACLQDIILYYPKVKIGGVIGGHDFSMKSVEIAVRKRFDHYEQRGDDWWVIKKE